MISQLTYTRVPLWVRLVKPVRCWQLRREIRCAEVYADQTARGGIFTPDEVATLRANITPLRALLIWWQAQ